MQEGLKLLCAKFQEYINYVQVPLYNMAKKPGLLCVILGLLREIEMYTAVFFVRLFWCVVCVPL